MYQSFPRPAHKDSKASRRKSTPRWSPIKPANLDAGTAKDGGQPTRALCTLE